MTVNMVLFILYIFVIVSGYLWAALYQFKPSQAAWCESFPRFRGHQRCGNTGQNV